MGKVTEKSFDKVKEHIVNLVPELKDVKLEICPDAEEAYQESLQSRKEEGEDEARVYAHTLHKPNVVCYTERMDNELTEEERQGILVHEFGHIYANRHLDEYEDDDCIAADVCALEKFGVVLTYNDRDIEEAKLPLGSDIGDDDELTEEEQKELEKDIDGLFDLDEDEDEYEDEEEDFDEDEDEIEITDEEIAEIENMTDEELEEELSKISRASKKAERKERKGNLISDILSRKPSFDWDEEFKKLDIGRIGFDEKKKEEKKEEIKNAEIVDTEFDDDKK